LIKLKLYKENISQTSPGHYNEATCHIQAHYTAFAINQDDFSEIPGTTRTTMNYQADKKA
jgi:hypothetical protein